MTLDVTLKQIKYLRIHNISIHTDFYHNRVINVCARKN